MVTVSPRLSKSKIVAGLQCERRLWLETYRRDAVEVSAGAQAVFDAGNEVGEIARRLFGPGVLVGHVSKPDTAVDETATLLATRPRQTLFEAAFRYSGVLVRADVLQPATRGYDLIEVKSSTEVKDYHLNDCAIQAWVIERAGLPLRHIKLAHIDNSFVYDGSNDYTGLLQAEDVTAEVRARMGDVPGWVRRFKSVLGGSEPDIHTGEQCHDPFECPLFSYCRAQEPAGPKYPVEILPRAGKLLAELKGEGYTDLCKVPANRLENERHQRIRAASITGRPFLDKRLARELNGLAFPRFYLDFETVSFAVPRWIDTRPYQPMPFQWSCHIERKDGSLEAEMFLDLSGSAPMRSFAESLVAVAARRGPILVYNIGFERSRTRELAERFPDLAPRLEALTHRMLDLLPIVREHYYHPAMNGSWSIKKVIPTVAPELDYERLDGVATSSDAPLAYIEATNPQTPPSRRAELERSLRHYCANDTMALVRLVQAFSKA